MELSAIRDKIPSELYEAVSVAGVKELRPAQEKAINAGLLEGKNLLVCTPTASGKTLVAELAACSAILSGRGRAVYIVPLKALASEKYKSFKARYGTLFKVALSIGDLDSSDSYLSDYDLVVCTAEKLDSLMRHGAAWLRSVKVVVVDEIHLLNEPKRGPVLEVLITLLRQLLSGVQVIGLSATIGNAEELAGWLGANLVVDDWRPVELHHGIYYDGRIDFRK